MIDPSLLASQLRQPHNEFGKEVALQMNYSNDVLTLSSIRSLKLNAGDRVLEIGMGNGLFCKDVLETENTVYTGYDFSELMVAEASVINKAFIDAGKANFVLGDATAMPFEHGSFDKIFTINTIYFWEDPSKILSEISRVLKPGGLLSIGLRTEESMSVLPFVQYGFTLYGKEKITALLMQNNFNVIDISITKDKELEREGQKFHMDNIIAVCSPR